MRRIYKVKERDVCCTTSQSAKPTMTVPFAPSRSGSQMALSNRLLPLPAYDVNRRKTGRSGLAR